MAMTINPSNPNTTARDATARAGETASKIGQDASDAARDLSRKASDAVDQASDMAHEQLESMAAYVRKNPLQATAIAASVGFAFALLARR